MTTAFSLRKLSRLYRSHSSRPMELNDSSRMVFMSDCHRGNGGRGDDFARNRLIFLHALAWYRNQGFTYVEAGDGEELWENGSFSPIHWAYSDIYIRMGFLHSDGRLIFLWGNHNNLWRKPENARRQLLNAFYHYYDGRPSPVIQRNNTLPVHEAIVLKHRESGLDILVTHGHQGELWSDGLWRISRFLVRRVWRFLQNAGLRPRITPAGNYALMKEVESRLTAWTRNTGVALITGHTHQPEFPSPGGSPYFNCGSCVHPGSITAMEIMNGEIALVKWQVSTPLASGTGAESHLFMARELLEGPVPLAAYAPSSISSSTAASSAMERGTSTAG